MKEISKLLTPFNLQIIELLVDESISVRDLANKINCSPAKITQFIKIFLKHRLIKISKEKNRKIINLNKDNPLMKEIITLLFTFKILSSKTFNELKKKSKSIGVYGSVVEGTLDKKSDIDLWVLIGKKISLIETGEIRQKISKELNRETSIKFLTEKDIQNLKEKDKIFYNELEYKSKILSGEGF